ncbi:GntR family transcriptional regulator [Dietzia sp. HMSC21D01]|nr:GntR family transcriptional regulator [Dietzia sp. HMSC21D01]
MVHMDTTGDAQRGPGGVSRPQKTALLVAKRIVEDIARRGNTVGDRLPPEHLMLEEYGVGRGTLRESLRYLELQGAITLKPGPGGGPIVQQPDGGTLAAALSLLMQFENAPFSTIMEARAAMEPSIARLAAGRMNREALEELRLNVEATREGAEEGEYFTEDSERFHALIAWGSGNVLFGYLFDALLGILAGASMGVAYPKRQRDHTCAIHEDIYRAIADRDAVAAHDLMAQHITDHHHYLKKKFRAALEQPIRWDLAW